MNNQPCYNKDGEFLGWFSPSLAVCNFVFLITEHGVYILATKRGEGCPDRVGLWNCQCGYVDFKDKEGTIFTAIRETYEETGLTITSNDIKSYQFTGVPDENGNYVHVFYTKIYGEPSDYNINSEHSEEGEVADISWIPVKEIDNYQWAFGHDIKIKEIYEHL